MHFISDQSSNLTTAIQVFPQTAKVSYPSERENIRNQSDLKLNTEYLV